MTKAAKGSWRELRIAAPKSVDDRALYSGLIRLHILHRAAERPIFGQAMIDELAVMGYRLSAGTLYPILHGLEHRVTCGHDRRYVTAGLVVRI